MFVGSYILNGNSLKVYMLAYNHMEICILFWKVDRTRFKGVIALFEKVISRKKLALFGELKGSCFREDLKQTTPFLQL
jgi:hypothetical protein